LKNALKVLVADFQAKKHNTNSGHGQEWSTTYAVNQKMAIYIRCIRRSRKNETVAKESTFEHNIHSLNRQEKDDNFQWQYNRLSECFKEKTTIVRYIDMHYTPVIVCLQIKFARIYCFETWDAWFAKAVQKSNGVCVDTKPPSAPFSSRSV
jgi:hypothetical protein